MGIRHYSDAIMSAIASQITGVSSVCSNFCSGADQRKHQSIASLTFVRGIHRWSHYLNQSWVNVIWTLRNKLQYNFNQDAKLSYYANAYEYIVCEMAAIFFLWKLSLQALCDIVWWLAPVLPFTCSWRSLIDGFLRLLAKQIIRRLLLSVSNTT